CPACFMRYSSSRNSRGCKSSSFAPRLTICDSRSSSRSATRYTVSSPRATRAGYEVGAPLYRLLAAGAAAPRHHLDPGEQFGERIGLGQIVIAAGAQALDAVIDLAERGQDQHWRLDTLGAQFADHREAIALGEHAVDDRDVVLPVRCQRQA